MQGKSLPLVPRSDGRRGIFSPVGRRRDLRDHPAVGPPELKLAVRLAFDLVALFVDCSMVPATEQSQVGERRRAALGPLTDVVALAEADAAAGEAAAAVPVVQRAP